MDKDSVKALFDQQAAGYDQQWARLAPIRDCLHLLVQSVFRQLPEDARILCVGAGTGAEMAYLAGIFPRWRFTAVDPSSAMIAVCRQRAQSGGYLDRCTFHAGYLDSPPEPEPHHGATCFLVSQFILEPQERVGFFRSIAARMWPGGVLAATDLAADITSASYDALLETWFSLMTAGGLQPEAMERMRAAYARDVAVIPPAQVASLIASAGFAPPVQFFQAGLIHGWFTGRQG